MIGDKISHFRVVGKLGAGGMGEVYRAEDLNLNREVAIKVLPDASFFAPGRNCWLRICQGTRTLLPENPV